MQSFFLPKTIVETRRQDKDSYHDFVSSFVAPVVGKRKFDKTSYKYLLSRYVSVSDEAFALLIFENNYDRWLDMAIKDNWTTSDVMPLYTTGGNASQTPRNLQPNQVQKNTSRTSMYQGWSVQGIRRFNILYDLVYKERDSEAGTLFEEQFLLSMQDKKEKGKQKNSTKKNIEYEMCRHDLWVMEDGINENTDAGVLGSGHYKNDVSNDNWENDDGEIAVEDTDFNENDDEDNNDDDSSSASSDGFKRAVAV